MLSVKELRAREVYNLATFKNEIPSAEDLAEARKLMNSFYRLCGLCETNLYLANNERTCNTRYTRESEDRETRWYNRLNNTFKSVYGLELIYFSFLPSIVKRDEDGHPHTKIYTYFYN